MAYNGGNTGTEGAQLPSERVLREFAPYPYQSVDEEGTVLAVNDAWLATLGYEREAVEGERLGEFLTDDSHAVFESTFQTFKADGSISGVEFEMVDADGDVIDVSLEGKIEYDDDGEFVRTHCQFHDVTARSEREQEMHRLTREYEALLENTADAIFVVDVETTASDVSFRFELANPSHEILSELEPEEVRGKTPHDVFDAETAAELRAGCRRCLEEGESVTLEATLSTPNGEMVWQLSLAPITVNGDVDRIIGSARDITERKEFEQRLKEQRDNLDILNQVLRHDIRNDLQLVTVYAELLSDHVDNQEDEAYVETILENAEHAVELTKTARMMADVMLTTGEERQERTLRRVLERTLDEIRSTYDGTSLTVDGSLPSVTVLADDMLDSVFRNILKNAIQHNDKSVPEVTVSVQQSADNATVRIADNGPGVPDGQKEDIFGKGEKGLDSQGTGIGLYLVNRLVDSYGGDVWVEDRAEHSSAGNRPGADDREGQSPSGSRPGADDNDPEGAVFVVELPTVNR